MHASRWYLLHKTSYRRFCLKFRCHGLVVVEFVWHHSIADTRIPPTRRKRHHDISYTSGVIACFVSNFVAMATRVCPVKFDWHHLIACPGEPPVRGKHLGDISYTRRVKGDFVLNFVAMATRAGSVVVKFDWHHSIARPRKPSAIRKDLRAISYTSRVIADFVSNFVAMATRVGRSRIYLASFNSPQRIHPYWVQAAPRYFPYERSYSLFCIKFHCHGNQGRSC